MNLTRREALFGTLLSQVVPIKKKEIGLEDFKLFLVGSNFNIFPGYELFPIGIESIKQKESEIIWRSEKILIKLLTTFTDILLVSPNNLIILRQSLSWKRLESGCNFECSAQVNFEGKVPDISIWLPFAEATKGILLNEFKLQ